MKTLDPRTRISRRDADFLIESYLESLGCPEALSVWLLWSSGRPDDHKQIVDRYVDPKDFNSVASFQGAHRAYKFLSKFIDLNLEIDRETVAIEGAERAEVNNRKTNRYLRSLLSGGVNPLLDSKLFEIQQIVSSILGPVPDSFRDTGWSKGRTTSAYGPGLSVVQKYAAQLDVTVDLVDDLLRVINDSPAWAASVLDADGPCSLLPTAVEIVRGNVMITVPKNAKTDRVICYEPHGNIRRQLAIGQYIRRRLLGRGIDLSDQSHNRRKARYGSLSGDLSTIDLSMASDTLSAELVFQVLPIDWLDLLDKARSHYTLWPDGSWRLNEKFSSMGNGFTFELESLLFYAVCSSVTGGVSVYGDDIVVPTHAYKEVIKLLEDVGFTPNAKKSFSEGYFRESCGGDYFAGVDVTPVYLRQLRTYEDVVKLHNQVRSKVCSSGVISYSLATRLSTWRQRFKSLLGPQGYGDGHYHVNFDEACPRRAGFEVDGWWFYSFLRVYRKGVGFVEGEIPKRYFWSSICALTGPELVRDSGSQFLSRKWYTVKQKRLLANFCWPELLCF